MPFLSCVIQKINYCETPQSKADEGTSFEAPSIRPGICYAAQFQILVISIRLKNTINYSINRFVPPINAAKCFDNPYLH